MQTLNPYRDSTNPVMRGFGWLIKPSTSSRLIANDHWCSVTLGKYSGHMHSNDSRRALNIWAGQLLRDIPYAKEETELSLAIAQVSGLGFTEPEVPRGEILKRAVEMGYGLAPAEVGRILAEEWDDQPPSKVQIGMEPHAFGKVLCPGVQKIGDMRAFFLTNENDRKMLHLVDGDPDCTYPARAWFVFASPRQGLVQ